MEQNKIEPATSVSVEIHKYPGLCGPFKECTRHGEDAVILSSDREMMNSSNSPAAACLKLPSSLPNWAKTPSVRDAGRRLQEGTTEAWLYSSFFPLSNCLAAARGEKDKGQALMISFMSPAPKNDQQQEIAAQGSRVAFPWLLCQCLHRGRKA